MSTVTPDSSREGELERGVFCRCLGLERGEVGATNGKVEIVRSRDRDKTHFASTNVASILSFSGRATATEPYPPAAGN